MRLRSRNGFTLVELLVAFVVLGILVAFAINRSRAKTRVYVALMQTDLRNLVTAQEAYYADSQKYATAGQLNFRTSANVVIAGVSTSAEGWSAQVQHTLRSGIACAVYIGNPSSIYPPATAAGVISCG